MAKESETSAEPTRPQSSLARKIVVAVLIVAAFAVVIFLGLRKRGTRFDAFAKCLAAKQAKMYGAYWCPHCADQKAMFESSFQYVPYVECGVSGSREEAPLCKDAGIKALSYLAICRCRTSGRHIVAAVAGYQDRMQPAMIVSPTPALYPAHSLLHSPVGLRRCAGFVGVALSSLWHLCDFLL